MKYQNKILIVGCGQISETFHLPALLKFLPKDNIYLHDINEKNAANLGLRFQISKFLKDLNSIPEDIDTAIVAVPFQYSFTITSALLSKKINVLSEKPIATTKEQITILNKLSQENDVVLCGNHTRRFFPSINKLKEKLKNHKIKKINIFEGDPFGWNSKSGFYFQGNRGVLLDRGPHIINIINFLTDSKEFNSLSFMHNAHNKDLPESHCKIILKSSEITVQIVVSWIYKLSNEIEVITDKGIFKIGVSSFNFFSYQRGNKKYNITAYPIRTQFDQMSNDVIKSFLDEVNYKKSNSVLSEDIYQSIVLIEKLYDIGKKFNAK